MHCWRVKSGWQLGDGDSAGKIDMTRLDFSRDVNATRRSQYIPNHTNFIYIYTRTHTHTHARTHPNTHIHTHTHTHTHTHMYIYVSMYLFTGLLLHQPVIPSPKTKAPASRFLLCRLSTWYYKNYILYLSPSFSSSLSEKLSWVNKGTVKTIVAFSKKIAFCKIL